MRMIIWAAVVFFPFAFPVIVDSCAVGPATVLFVAEKAPVDVRGKFLNGQLGIVGPQMEPVYLIGAFRMLSGGRLTEAERAALYPQEPPAATGISAYNAWERVRQMWAPQPSVYRPVQPYKQASSEGGLSYFLNCNDDAFETAIATLQTVQKEWGLTDGRFMSWLLAQDQVFANCAGTQVSIPTEPGPAMDPELASDRRYQIAAARFYAGEYRSAAGAFLKIANESQSRWQTLGRYLAARALVRAAQLTDDRTANADAKALLESVLQDPALAQWHGASRALVSLVRLRLEPASYMGELGTALMKPADEPADPAEIRRAALDFIFLIKRTTDHRNRPLPLAYFESLEAASELAAWIKSISRERAEGHQTRAVQWWRRTANPAWLIAALKESPDRDLPELLAAAAKVGSKSPAFESIAYYATLRESSRGNNTEARAWADRGLSRAALVESARNLILRERTRLARNWDEFLTYGLRRPGGYGNEKDPWMWTPLPDGAIYGFDTDVVTAFNSEIPLGLWLNASRNKALPGGLQLRVAQSGWMRAAMLGRFDEARQLLQRVVELNPAASQGAAPFLNANEPGRLRFTAMYLYLRAPGLSPTLRDAGVENENLATPHPSRQCPFPPSTATEYPRFLEPTDRKAAQAEVEQLNAVTPWFATTSLRAVLDWANAHPDDELVPEALHRAIQTSRYGCRDEATGKYSQQAYQLLHTKYARTKWAAMTKYWYQ